MRYNSVQNFFQIIRFFSQTKKKKNDCKSSRIRGFLKLSELMGDNGMETVGIEPTSRDIGT